MDIKLHGLTFDVTSALVFIISVAIGLYIVFELVVSYVELFHQ